MKKLIIIPVLTLFLLQGTLNSQTVPANQTINKDFSGFINSTAAYDDIKITKITKADSLDNGSTVFYVIMDKGLKFKIKPKNHLILYSPVFISSPITGEKRISDMKIIGYIKVLNSDPDISKGKLEFDKGIDVNNEFNQELSYARKKEVYQTIYVIPRLSLWSEKLSSRLDVQTKSGIGLGYSIFNRWGGGYAEFSLLKSVMWENYGDPPVNTVTEYKGYLSLGFIKKVDPKTGLRIGATASLEQNFLVDFSIVKTLNNGLSLINGLSFTRSYEHSGIDGLLYSFGVGYTF